MSETHSAKVAITVALIGLFGTLGAVILNKYLPDGSTPENAASPTESITSSVDEMVEDPEGNRYPTVQLVGKRWLTQNLNYYVTGSACYDADPENCRKYGKLYNWEAAQTACAALGAGWRLPTVDEWKELALFYGGYGYYDRTIKEVKKIGDPEKAMRALSKGGNSGFEALTYGGWGGGAGDWHSFDVVGIYWSRTEDQEFYFNAQTTQFFDSDSGVDLHDSSKKYLLSCRCIQDLE